MKRQLRENDLFTVRTETNIPGLNPGKLYAVLSTTMTGGGTGHGPYDIFPDGHEVTAVLLPSISSKPTKPSGGKIRFYQSGCFNQMVDPSHIVLKGKVVREERFTISRCKP